MLGERRGRLLTAEQGEAVGVHPQGVAQGHAQLGRDRATPAVAVGSDTGQHGDTLLPGDGEPLDVDDVLAVDHLVGALELGLGHAQGGDPTDHLEDDEGRHDVPHDDDEQGEGLHHELMGVAVDPAREAHVRIALGAEVLDHVGGRGDADGEPADGAGEAVGVDDAEGVVDPPEDAAVAQDVHREPGHRAGDDAEDHGAVAGDPAGAGGDRDQAGDHAVDHARGVRLAGPDDVEDHPGEQRDGGADVGVEHRGGGVGVGEVRITAVEARPAQPQEAASGEGHHQVVRGGVLPVAHQARPDHRRGGEARGRGGDVDHVATRVVEGAELGEPAAAPDHEGADGVDAGDPHRGEQHPRLEAHPAEHGAGEDDDGDGGEDELEVDERRAGEVQVGDEPVQQRDARLVELVTRPEHRMGLAHQVVVEVRAASAHRRTEGHVVREQGPDDQRHRERVDDHQRRVHRPAALDDAAVEDRQPRDAHDPDERRGDQLPGVVA